ncbi:MAG: cation:proton antiporter, partial [Candidatus Rokuibacteriota bacterium]
MARALGEVFERVGQSAMIGEILAGVLLGPAILRFIEDPTVMGDLAVVSSLGTFMIVLLAGLEMDVREISRAIRGGGLVIGVCAFVLPFVSG